MAALHLGARVRPDGPEDLHGEPLYDVLLDHPLLVEKDASSAS